MSKVRNIRVDDSTWERWQSEAKEAGLSVSALVRVRMSQVFITGGSVDPKNFVPGEINPVCADMWRVEELPVMTKAVQPKVVPQIAGVSKASEWKPPMPSLPKYQPKPEKRGKK